MERNLECFIYKFYSFFGYFQGFWGNCGNFVNISPAACDRYVCIYYKISAYIIISFDGKGIHKFLDKVQYLETYIVIDDHTFTDFDEEIRAHLILTDYSKGLTDEDAEKAIRLLNTNAGGE